jgi:hypothetical protein
MTEPFKVNGDTITYNGVTYKKVETPKEPTLRDRIADVIGSHLDMVEFALEVDSDALAQDLMNHILEWIPDYSHNDDVAYHNNVTTHNIEDYRKGWDAHAMETFKVFDWEY